MRFQPPRGMRDLGPAEFAELSAVIDILQSTVSLWGFRTIQTPVLEQAGLFEVKSGADIRQQLYVLTDKGGRELALRPDITPALTRYFGSSCQARTKPVRLAARDRVWRYEAPQAGRFREINQFNIEQFGGTGPVCDAELVGLFIECFERLDLNYTVQLGDRRLLTAVLTKYDIERSKHASVVRILDKADKIDRADLVASLSSTEERPLVPSSTAEDLADFAYLQGQASEVLETLAQVLPNWPILQDWQEMCQHLTSLGVLERCTIRPGLARGFDYYNGLLMEAVSPNTLGVGAVGGGGRYDDLTVVYGYPPSPAAGFSIGLDRIVMLRRARDPKSANESGLDVVVGYQREAPVMGAIQAARELRSRGLMTELVYEGRNPRKIEDHAKRRGARWCLIVNTLDGGSSLLDMVRDVRTTAPVSELLETLR
jgi:histidyl-tRNA synthetase